MAAPEPHEIFERTKREGERRLSRPLLELVTTAFVAGVDVVFGLVAFAIVDSAMKPHFGKDAAHVFASLAFGIAFVFIVIGRSELFTENFLVPVAGLDRDRRSLLKLLELWLISPIANVLGATALIIVLTVHGVLPHGVGQAFRDTVHLYDHRNWLTSFLSAVGAGALITLMTWLVEGADSMGTRIVSAWISGAVLALVSFNHVIVVTITWVFGVRYGSHAGVGDLVDNFFLAAGGNLIGGMLFVTLTRAGQAKGSGDGG
jgi:formate-nitrite transporter family protein